MYTSAKMQKMPLKSLIKHMYLFGIWLLPSPQVGGRGKGGK